MIVEMLVMVIRGVIEAIAKMGWDSSDSYYVN